MDHSSIEDICPLSPMQDGLLFQSLYDPDPEAYFVQMSFRCRGVLQKEAFRQTWQLLADRHSVLRSAFLYEGLARPAQVVLKQREPQIDFISLDNHRPEERDHHIHAFEQQDRRRGFDLARDMLMRMTVFALSPNEHRVVWSFHHILFDGWSLSILHAEFMLIYTALAEGKVPALQPAFPYRNYVRWFERQDREEARRFWKTYLADYRGLVGIPRLDAGAHEAAFALQELAIELDADLTATLRSVATKAGVTLNTLVQCVWAIVLTQYNQASDVVFGMIVSGRPPDLNGVQRMVGLCINAVPVRFQLTPEQTFIEMLRDAQKAALACQDRHHLPLADILTQSPLGAQTFDHLLTFENYRIEPEAQTSGQLDGAAFALEMLDAHDRTHYPFTLIATPGDTLHLRFSFNANIYPEDQMRRTQAHVLAAFQSIARSRGDLLVGEVNILPAAERELVLDGFNDTAISQTDAPDLVGWFEAQVKRTPDHIAVVCGARRLTYEALNTRANQLAHVLRNEYRLRPDDRVGLWLDRSEELVVAIWGILKAGAAYVPVSPDHPAERQRHILSDSACRVVITEETFAAEAKRVAPTATIIDIRGLPAGATENPTSVTEPGHLAYVIYTSGSTGLPKGCQIEHHNLVHYLRWADGFYFSDKASGCFGLYSPLSFDLTVTSLYLPLLRGQTLIVFPGDVELLDILEQSFREDSPIDSIKLTPSHITLLRHLPPSRSNIQLAIVGGEALKLEHVEMLRRFNPAMAIYNEYGPTETTVGCVVKRIEAFDDRILIGKPIANTRIYILRGETALPIGMTGELVIGGAGVARGYINRDDLNRRMFVEDPFAPGQRIYRTGDLGRWLPDGQLELLGRADYQVKVNGHRIELGEIEQQLMRHASLQDAAVVVKDGNELVAFLNPDSSGKPDFGRLREKLAAVLPDYMIPTRFVSLEEFPLTANGKVDRQALTERARTVAEDDSVTSVRSGQLKAGEVLPRTATETVLAEIWQAVLGVDGLGVQDNFFHLGGHSLKAIQVLSRVNQRLGRKVPMRALFSHPTIEAIARLIDGQSADTWQRIEPAPRQNSYPLSDGQKRLWLVDRMGGGQSLNTALVLSYRGRIDALALERALLTVIERHEILRTAFVLVDGQPRQTVFPPPQSILKRIDLSDEMEADARAKEIADKDLQEAFDLTHPSLLRAVLIEKSGDEGLFVITAHHIIGDEWSNHLLIGEISELYRAFTRGADNPLPPLRLQYKDYAQWQTGRDFSSAASYWKERLEGVAAEVALPFDFPTPGTRAFLGGSIAVRLSPEVTAAARDFARSQGTLLSSLLLTVFTLTLYHHTRQSDLCVGLSCANRSRLETENLIGFFVNIVPIRVRFEEEKDFTDMLVQVAARVTEAVEFQDYPFDQLVQAVNPPRSSNRPPLVNILYSFHDFRDLRFDLGAEAGSADGTDPVIMECPWEQAHESAKFDLTLFVTDHSSHLELTLEYDRAVLREDTARGYLRTLEALTQSVLQLPRSDG